MRSGRAAVSTSGVFVSDKDTVPCLMVVRSARTTVAEKGIRVGFADEK